jgi:hypothetical protein
VARARGYPWHAEPPVAAPPAELERALRDGAVPLLAYGSNAAPEVLRRKLGADVAGQVLARPVVLEDTDVVFSAHVSHHGAVPATPVASPGTEVDAWLLTIPARAMRALDATEPNYRRELRGDAHLYVSRHGPLLLDGAPVALAAVPARGRTLRALTEHELLERLRERIAPAEAPDEFVLSHVLHEELRLRRSALLRRGL